MIYRTVAITRRAASSATDDAQYVEFITKSPGIYFDPVSNLKLINDHVHFVIPVDLKYIKPHLTNIENILGSFKFICEQNKAMDDFRCLNALQPLTSLYNDILRDYDSISHMLSTKTKRSAWFAGIGSIMKKLFGTMDENDSEKYHYDIQTLHSNEKRLAHLIKQSIFISKSAILNFNKTLETIIDNEARLNDVTNNLLKNVSIVTNELLFRNKLSEVLNVLHASLLTLSFKLEDIVNSIMFANSNTLHPSVATPTQLCTDIESSIRHLPKYKEFPVTIDVRNINVLLKISELAAYYSSNSIVFVLKVPLVYHIDYDLYKVIPVPITHNVTSPNSYALIVPTINYVALSKDKSTYCTLDDLNSCKTLYNGYIACNTLNILSVNSNPICEIEFMTKIIKALPSQCNTKFIYGHIDIWQNLGHNNWIFVQTRPTKLTLECDLHNKEITIIGTGILSLKPQCVAFCRNVKLLAMLNLEVNIPPINSDFNLIDDKCCNLNTFQKSNINTSAVTISNINLDKLNNLKDQADQLSTEIDDFMSTNNNVFTNHISFPIVTIIFMISFIIFIIYYCKANHYVIPFSCKNSPPNVEEEIPGEEEIPPPRLRV